MQNPECVSLAFTFLVGVDAIVSVQFLMSLLFLNSLAKDCVPVHDIDRLLLRRARSRRHSIISTLPRQRSDALAHARYA